MNGLEMKYFVIKPKGNGIYAEASRKAMKAYAAHIDAENRKFANDLYDWVNREERNAKSTNVNEEDK